MHHFLICLDGKLETNVARANPDVNPDVNPDANPDVNPGTHKIKHFPPWIDLCIYRSGTLLPINLLMFIETALITTHVKQTPLLAHSTYKLLISLKGKFIAIWWDLNSALSDSQHGLTHVPYPLSSLNSPSSPH